MPVPAWVGSAIQGGAGIVSPIISGLMNKSENRKQRQWSEDMYWMQEDREWWKWMQQNQYNEGLWNKQNEYNERMWHQMNEYNSPMAQMKRFKEAGLNPNLIYGNMNNSPAIQTAQQGDNTPGRGTLQNVPQHQWGDFLTNAAQSLSNYYQFRESSARVNNLEAQNDLLQQEAAQKAAQTALYGSQTAKTEQDRQFSSDLHKYSMEAAQLGLKKTNQEMDLALNADQRAAAQNASSLAEAGERILNMQQQRITEKQKQELNNLDLELKRLGVQPSDAIWIRMLGRWYDNIKNNLNEKTTEKDGRYYYNWSDQ